jgi:hypothetical protein
MSLQAVEWWHLLRRQLEVSSLPRSLHHFTEFIITLIVGSHINLPGVIEKTRHNLNNIRSDQDGTFFLSFFFILFRHFRQTTNLYLVFTFASLALRAPSCVY